MTKNVAAYFADTVIPAIRSEHLELVADMSIIVLGSAGLGVADESSDLEAAVYLDDTLWHEKGGQLQLTLNRRLRETCPYKMEGSTLCVWPTSWLLEGRMDKLLNGGEVKPWEEVAIEDLFTIQSNLIVWDPKDFLRRLRAATGPRQMPGAVWKQRLLLCLKKLLWEDFGELRSCVKRKRIAEAHILFGLVMESLLHAAFLISRRYYPWRTHLRWAFGQLPSPAADAASHIDVAVASTDWSEKMAAVERVVTVYKKYISENGILPEIDILSSDMCEELVWAERLKAWENPNWRDWIVQCKEKAAIAGYHEDDSWVWSLWGWAKGQAERQDEPDDGDPPQAVGPEVSTT